MDAHVENQHSLTIRVVLDYHRVMEPSYSVSFDTTRGLLSLTLKGFFTVQMVRELAVHRDEAVLTLGCAPNQHLTICDISEQMTSSKEVVAEFERVIGNPKFASRRLAFVVRGSIERIQTRRVVVRDDVGYFDTVEEAEAWLFDIID